MEPIRLDPIPRYEPPAVPADQAPPDPDADRIWADWINGRSADQSSEADPNT